MFAITFNMIPTILSESEKIVIVQRCRGYQSRSFNIFGNILPVIIPLLHRTLRRAEQLSLVLLSRGYDEK
jgi:energy-coupling factor transporter transmembrane protein EcfT